jgi:glycosyltransferase involved in cell wall biosynthesis
VPNKTNKQPFFSVVIPTLNEEKYLPLLLKDLANQTWQDFEIIHVDGDSSDKTVQKAKDFADRLTITTQIVKKRNVAFQRNSGAKLARASWIIFMDADNRLPKEFLAKIKQQLDKNPATDIFTCLVEVKDNGDLLKKSSQRAINYGLELYYLLGKVSAFGAMIGCRKEIFDKLSFDEKQKIYEDTIFAQAVADAGYTFTLFKKPRYNYSLRRIEKEGMLKILRVAARMNLHYLQGKDFSKTDLGYTMKGGKYYDQIPKFPLKDLRRIIEKTSGKQLEKVKRLLKRIREI